MKIKTIGIISKTVGDAVPVPDEHVEAAGVALENVAGLTPDTVNGLTFLRSLPAAPAAGGKPAKSRRKAA